MPLNKLLPDLLSKLSECLSQYAAFEAIMVQKSWTKHATESYYHSLNITNKNANIITSFLGEENSVYFKFVGHIKALHIECDVKKLTTDQLVRLLSQRITQLQKIVFRTWSTFDHYNHTLLD